ncbi:hypothetical protein N8Z33_00410 [Flavobacteriaceae bacterium]|nr:hypothetical protein [Flavobacteriaceae bacterium]
MGTKTLEVSQTIQFQNNTKTPLQTLYFNDWSHAYSSSKSPLAQRFAEEYDRRFYLGSKTKRGRTTDLKISIKNKKKNWYRLDHQIDIVKIDLDEILEPEEQITISLTYNIELPDASYTGYGKISDDDYFLKNCFIQLAPHISGNWITNSNLDLEEISSLPSNFSIEWNIPSQLLINSNLTQWKQNLENDRKIITQSISKAKEIQFHISKKEYASYDINGLAISTDLREVSEKMLDPTLSLIQIEAFVREHLGVFPHSKILLSQRDYQKRSYFGLSAIPSVFHPFSDRFEFEIKALNVYLNHYLTEAFLVDPRESSWLTGGLHTLLVMEYVDQYYPDQKLLGAIPKQPLLRPFIKNYSLSNASFNYGFLYFNEYVLRNNIQQSSFTSKSELIKFNERVAISSHVAHGIRYAYEYYGKEKINNAIRNQIGKVQSKEQLIKSLENQVDIPWLFQDYLGKRNSIDLKFKSVRRNSDSLSVQIIQNYKNPIPYTLAQVKGNRVIQSLQITSPKKNDEIKLKRYDADYLVINPKLKIPEFNHQNNYRKLKGTTLKPFKYTFIKDIEDPKKSQVFFNPKIDFNAYDGVTLGTKLSNKAFQRKPFSYDINPNYSTRLNELVGSFVTSYRLYDEDSSLYLYQLGFSGSSFHYDENLRYKIFVPSFTVVKRPDDFRSNKREVFSLSLTSVNREFGTTPILTPNYTIGNIGYTYSNKEAIRLLKVAANFEISDNFGKFNVDAEFRHLFHDGRTLSLRFFGGKFLWDNTQDTTYFDYSLNRTTDYLFRYGYLGRSDDDGIYSQQFILSEGGFKSRFESPKANDYILATNLGFSLWKWVEVYADFGITKNKNTRARSFYDSGIRINLVPDYLEFYFPIQNSENYVLNDANYLSNMRFVLTVDINNLKRLFTRRWF